MAAKRDPHECRGAGQVPHNHQLTLLNAAAARAVLDPVADPVVCRRQCFIVFVPSPSLVYFPARGSISNFTMCSLKEATMSLKKLYPPNAEDDIFQETTFLEAGCCDDTHLAGTSPAQTLPYRPFA